MTRHPWIRERFWFWWTLRLRNSWWNEDDIVREADLDRRAERALNRAWELKLRRLRRRSRRIRS